jgi:hypothetical protein
MIKDITQNELLLLAYNDVPLGEREGLLIAIASDDKLTEQYTKILEEMQVLNTVSYTPHPTSIQIIMEESCSSSSLETI